jgi:hypothetical protein
MLLVFHLYETVNPFYVEYFVKNNFLWPLIISVLLKLQICERR